MLINIRLCWKVKKWLWILRIDTFELKKKYNIIVVMIEQKMIVNLQMGISFIKFLYLRLYLIKNRNYFTYQMVTGEVLWSILGSKSYTDGWINYYIKAVSWRWRPSIRITGAWRILILSLFVSCLYRQGTALTSKIQNQAILCHCHHIT